MNDRLKELGDTIIRQHENATWIMGGCEAVEEFRLELRTCKTCFHVHEQPFLTCEKCGGTSI